MLRSCASERSSAARKSWASGKGPVVASALASVLASVLASAGGGGCGAGWLGREAGGGGGEPFAPFVDAGEGGLGIVHALPGEVEVLAVVGAAEESVAQFAAGVAFREDVADGVHVAERLRHFLAVDEEVLDVKPGADEFPAGRFFALGDFVFVVGKSEVGAAAVDVDQGRPGVCGVLRVRCRGEAGVGGEEFEAQRGTFDVPARAAPAPGRFPADVAVGLGPFFPEDEVAHAFLFVFVLVDARAGDEVFQVEMREAAVAGEGGDAEVDGAVVGGIGGAFFDELRDERDHPGNVVGGVGGALGDFDAEGLRVFEEGGAEGFGERAQGHAFFARAADGFVVDVGELHDVIDGVAEVTQRAPQEVDGDVGAEIADVAVVVDGRPADVERDAGRGERPQFLLPARHGVVELEGEHGGGAVSVSVRATPVGRWNG